MKILSGKSYFIGIVLLVFSGAACNVSALPQNHKYGGWRQKMEARQQRVQEQREHHRNEQQKNKPHLFQGTSNIFPVKNDATNLNVGANSAETSLKPNQANRPGAKFNRLTPEERKALRKQIHEMSADIYPHKQ